MLKMNKLLPLDPSSELDLCRGILLKQEQINMRKKYKRLSDICEICICSVLLLGEKKVAILSIRHTGSVLSLEQQRNQRSVEFFLQERKRWGKD